MQICWFPFVKGHSDIVVPMIPKPSKTNFHSIFFFSSHVWSGQLAFRKILWRFPCHVHRQVWAGFGSRKLFWPNVAWNFLPGSWGFPLATQAPQPVVIRISQWVVGTSSRFVDDVHIKSVPNHPFSSRTFQPWPWWQPPRWDFDFFERTCGNIKVEVTLPKGQVIGSTRLGVVWFSWGEIFN